ncbi:MAG: hypothetical protein MZV64_71360 [Ignavibacteriales bacterium]|nr:hypothetical protein [Ignavibacteriales bacterium]
MTGKVSRRWLMGLCQSTSPVTTKSAPCTVISSFASLSMGILRSRQGFMFLP